MSNSILKDFHRVAGARIAAVNGVALVTNYGDAPAEYHALRQTAGVLDLSARGRLCLLGTDRERLLNGQVTNDVKSLRPGQGCYAALVTAKGKVESDLNIHRLDDEFLLDFEPGYTAAVTARLERYLIADDVQVVDAAPHFGLLSVQGPRAREVVSRLDRTVALPAKPWHWVVTTDSPAGRVYVMNQPRLGTEGFDLFVPTGALAAVAERLTANLGSIDGRWVGWDALEWARIAVGIPRFGQDFDATNLAPEAGLETRAISYTKGCYIGQEVIARLRTYGQVAKALRGLRFLAAAAKLPDPGSRLLQGDRDVGYLTSITRLPGDLTPVALGYVRRECNARGSRLTVASPTGAMEVEIVTTPFAPG